MNASSEWLSGTLATQALVKLGEVFSVLFPSIGYELDSNICWLSKHNVSNNALKKKYHI
jgi:hypothetical protein